MLNTTCSAKERGGNGRANVMQYREMRDDGSNVETSRWDVYCITSHFHVLHLKG
jgi:hypothetical protein